MHGATACGGRGAQGPNGAMAGRHAFCNFDGMSRLAPTVAGREGVMFRFQNILVAVDFSQTSDDAVAAAAELSRTYHAQVHLLHVVPNVNIPYAIEPFAFDFGAYMRQSIDAAGKQLMEVAGRHPIERALLTTAVLSGVAATEIVSYAEEHAIDLIVLGAHGHGFIDRLLIGSVAERVARHAPCSVLMVPHVTRRLTTFEAQAVAGVEG